MNEEIERLLKEGDLLEGLKNTMVSILNTDEEHHEEMIEFCLLALDKLTFLIESEVELNTVLKIEEMTGGVSMIDFKSMLKGFKSGSQAKHDTFH